MNDFFNKPIEAQLSDSDGWLWKTVRSGVYRVRKKNNICYGVGSDNHGRVCPVVIVNSASNEPIVSFKGSSFAHTDINKAVEEAYKKAQEF